MTPTTTAAILLFIVLLVVANGVIAFAVIADDQREVDHAR